VRAIDPYTRGALRERLNLVGSAVNLRSFLDPPMAPGHTIKGSGLVSFKSNRFNTTSPPMDFTLKRAVDKHIQSLGVQSSDYNFGPVKLMDTKVAVSINGRRYQKFTKNKNNPMIFYNLTKNLNKI
jgi:hypothetical protein